MNEFMLWFIRPIAEFLGAVSLMIAIVVGIGIGFALVWVWGWCAKKIKAWRQP